ncbi:13917_t:CDS:2, partial [Dentiscutata heterogama]
TFDDSSDISSCNIQNFSYSLCEIAAPDSLNDNNSISYNHSAVSTPLTSADNIGVYFPDFNHGSDIGADGFLYYMQSNNPHINPSLLSTSPNIIYDLIQQDQNSNSGGKNKNSNFEFDVSGSSHSSNGSSKIKRHSLDGVSSAVVDMNCINKNNSLNSSPTLTSGEASESDTSNAIPCKRQRSSSRQPLCNACGLFLKLHGVVRPLSLKTDTIKKRNRNGGAVAAGKNPAKGVKGTVQLGPGGASMGVIGKRMNMSNSMAARTQNGNSPAPAPVLSTPVSNAQFTNGFNGGRHQMVGAMAKRRRFSGDEQQLNSQSRSSEIQQSQNYGVLKHPSVPFSSNGEQTKLQQVLDMVHAPDNNATSVSSSAGYNTFAPSNVSPSNTPPKHNPRNVQRSHTTGQIMHTPSTSSQSILVHYPAMVQSALSSENDNMIPTNGNNYTPRPAMLIRHRSFVN